VGAVVLVPLAGQSEQTGDARSVDVRVEDADACAAPGQAACQLHRDRALADAALARQDQDRMADALGMAGWAAGRDAGAGGGLAAGGGIAAVGG